MKTIEEKYEDLMARCRILLNEMDLLRCEMLSQDVKANEQESMMIVAVLKIASKYELYKDSRKDELVMMRHFLRHFLNTNTKLSLAKIAGFTGARNHATVLHSVKKHIEYMEINDKAYKQIVEQLSSEINELLTQ